MKSLIPIRGTHLYVEDFNDSNEEVLLYLHGGPGASCVDFCYQQAEALAKQVRVIALDQRGVLRSDAIKEDEAFGIQDMIEDCEALRIRMGIKNWSVLGHSFGGYLALMYALHYPDSVKKIIFETPSFDLRRSLKSLISRALAYSQSINNSNEIRECKKYLNASLSTQELWKSWGEIVQLLGDKKDHIYFHGIHPSSYNEIMNELVPSPELWDKNQQHILKLQSEARLFEDLTPKLKHLSQPSLLITGRYDPVCCEEQKQAYTLFVRDSKIMQFNNSGHMPRLEEPEKYTKEVLKFISCV